MGALETGPGLKPGDAAWIVLGPRAEGRDYTLLAGSRDAALSTQARQLLEDYALMTLAAAPINRRYFSFFCTEAGSDPLWALTATDEKPDAQRGVVRVTWCLMMAESRVVALKRQFASLRSVFPPADSPLPKPSTTLPDPPALGSLPSPPRAAVAIRKVVHAARRKPSAIMVDRSPEEFAFDFCDQLFVADNRPASFVTRADLATRGSFGATQAPWLICLRADDPPVAQSRFADYQLIRILADGKIYPQLPDEAPGSRLWDELWVNADLARQSAPLKMLVSSVNIGNAGDELGGVIRLQFLNLIPKMSTADSQASVLMQALAAATIRLNQEIDRTAAVDAIESAFAAMPASGNSPAQLSFYTEALLLFFLKGAEGAGVARWSFVLDRAFDQHIFLQLTPAAMDVLGVAAVSDCERMKLALHRDGVALPTLRVFTNQISNALQKDPENKNVAEIAGVLVLRLPREKEDESLNAAAFAILKALDTPTHRSVLANLIDRLGRIKDLFWVRNGNFRKINEEFVSHSWRIVKKEAKSREELVSAMLLGLDVIKLLDRMER